LTAPGGVKKRNSTAIQTGAASRAQQSKNTVSPGPTAACRSRSGAGRHWPGRATRMARRVSGNKGQDRVGGARRVALEVNAGMRALQQPDAQVA